jgi:hypothetical protein
MSDLSVLIPARNEMFLTRTVENLLENIEGDTEVIAICDGYWPEPGIADNPRVKLVHYTEPVGQRGGTNLAAKLSESKYIMKLDAHCAVDKGFDVKLMKDLEGHYDWTMVPRMYNLHGFDWQCDKCGNRTYQGPTPTKCEKCDNTTDFHREIVWKPRLSRKSDFMRFDNTMHFQYWGEFEKRPEGQGQICDLLCHVGACWMMHRERYWELGGCDENHGSWGQMGVEISCKTWLSGGRQVVNKNTWFSHMFRTQGGDFSFPYEMSGRQVDVARKYSRNLWMNDTWPQAKHNLEWLLRKFWPVPTWTEEDIKNLKSQKTSVIVETDLEDSVPSDNVPVEVVEKKIETPKIEIVEPKKVKEPLKLDKTIIYYTDNRLPEDLMMACQRQLVEAANGIPIISVSLKPIDLGHNVVIPAERGHLTMFMQILLGLEIAETDVAFLAEHDILYHPSHFEFTPERDDVFYFNENTFKVDAETGQAVFYYTKQTSGCCAARKLLVNHYRKRVARVAKEGRYDRNIGFEPGAHQFPRGIDEYGSERWMSDVPNIDLRHGLNLTKTRWSTAEFRNKNTCLGWTLADEVPGWGVTKGRMGEFLKEI